jgi:heme exporter protein B
MDRSVIYFGKLIGNLLFIFAMELLMLPLASIFFNIWLITPSLLLVVTLGTIGFAAVGTLFSALSVNTRAREVLLPILLFPIMVPVLIAGVRATGALLDGETLSDIAHWLRLVIAYDAIFIAVAFLLFDYVVEE